MIFVTHSLGGLIVKDALGQAIYTGQSHLQDILPSVKGIMFLGTSHRESHAATIAEVFCKVYGVVGGHPNRQLLQSLDNNSTDIARITDSFASLLDKGTFHIHSFREELETLAHMIVDDNSSTIGKGDEGKGVLLADHIEMAKILWT